MILYNLFPPLAGKFTHWKPHFKRAADLGFDWIFVNPVQKPGMSGSLYSIADYFALNPQLVDSAAPAGPEEQLKNAIQAAEDLGLKLMVDLVINHCAVDSALPKQHPQWFIHEADGGIAHPFCMEDGAKVVWGDLILFDHQHTIDPEGLYGYFFKIVEYLIGLGFKGFRCDAAYQLPTALWQRLIHDTRQRHPDTVFAAETLGCLPEQARSTAAAGFDYVFNSAKWWDFQQGWLLEQYNLTRDLAASTGFPESHDTERLLQEAQGNVNALKQRYLFTALFSAGVMMPVGFEFGFRKRLHVVRTRPEDWEQTQVDIRDFIRTVNALKKRYPLFQEETINRILPSGNPQVLVLWKTSQGTSQEALLVLNKSLEQGQSVRLAGLEPLRRTGKSWTDIWPEEPAARLDEPFGYALNPGQGLVLIGG